MLFEGNPGKFNTDAALPIPDPITVTQMVLTLDEIVAYDKNPRQLVNPEYSSIKSSIRNQRGLNNPFNVTRRPGSLHYMIQAGGNTRLQILRELYAETGDRAFNTVHCLYIPWQDETAVITAHMIENEMRGEMALIDKAYGIHELRTQMEQGNVLSDKAFSQAVVKLGYKLSTRQVRRLKYVFNLDRLIPKALRDGLSNRELDTIKKTEKAYLAYCEGKTPLMPEIFARNMAAFDNGAFDFERVRDAIEQGLGELLDVPSNRLSLQIDTLMMEDAKQPDLEELMDEPMEEYPDEYPASEGPLLQYPAGSLKAAMPQQLPPQLRQAPDLRVVDKPNTLASGDNKQHLSTLQRQGFVLATVCAQRGNMAHLILQRPAGMGFVVEMPDAPFACAIEYGIWWLLASISEQNAAQSHFAVMAGTKLHQLYGLAEAGAEEVKKYLGVPPTMQSFAFEVLNDPAVLKPNDYKAVFKLIDNCRTLRTHFSSALLWPDTQTTMTKKDNP